VIAEHSQWSELVLHRPPSGGLQRRSTADFRSWLPSPSFNGSPQNAGRGHCSSMRLEHRNWNAMVRGTSIRAREQAPK
jgi:hypothetical protein